EEQKQEEEEQQQQQDRSNIRTEGKHESEDDLIALLDAQINCINQESGMINDRLAQLHVKHGWTIPEDKTMNSERLDDLETKHDNDSDIVDHNSNMNVIANVDSDADMN